ncbi:MAG: tetratricopeptide repeat protein [Acidobacteria bacterium]|uniref:Tetratricopeptide repeat protein n=1 Tax=Candidatus Polarisedimenticola svalbardensis TaxID=2886004 RepID=A0A8J6Y2E7_9BACT|nr:tetratricopeptide repeat protein [Candidatus Polarisedimenticola svalbardensis]
MKQLRSGYGYSLRRVEEKARDEGGEIDNSQLSRYEKGVCYPSFDKLRVLAGVFNVSIQSFSDVVDLEAFEDLKPETGEPDDLIQNGLSALGAGDSGLAFGLFERAVELLEEDAGSHENLERIAQARINLAAALARLGKITLAETELRRVLKVAPTLDPILQARALLALSNVHAEQEDVFLAEIEAERAYSLAQNRNDDMLAARAVHNLGFILAQNRNWNGAIGRYREALERYEQLGVSLEPLRIRINIGTCYVALGKHREGIRILRDALQECQNEGNIRLRARAWTNLGEAYHNIGNITRARHCFRESEAICNTPDRQYSDLLFVNAWYEWQMARADSNPTRTRIAFGRLKSLRSTIEKKFPEVVEFDSFIERGKSDA